MYDITFFRETTPIKNDLVAGRYGQADAAALVEYLMKVSHPALAMEPLI